MQDYRNDKMLPNLIIEIKTENIWKQILSRTKTPMEALDNEDICIKNQQGKDYPEGILEFIPFLLLIDHTNSIISTS
ncbi:unnamed protein product [Adineta steineri]|uniref:Uncharacterized protein n=1 Tax=Adineta steineri TaxID=433720 RepID=A0A815H1Y6_9BILA|nr:unnamed protein product [Adineta steineri]CAF1339413.1 unnamed protein product [Adineta steineri]CAF1348251.1 unnamed protein product [Adineta steineri]